MTLLRLCLLLITACVTPLGAMAQTLASAPKTEAMAQQPVKTISVKGPYVLIDARTGDVLAQERAGEPWYPASLSKLMTAYVVFHKVRDGKLRLDQELTVSPLASGQEPSKIGIPPGKTVTVDFALQALLVYSANDMAYVLAEGAAGSVPAFADEMNAASRRLGLSASHFVNPNGLFDPRQVTSARDMAALAAVIIAEFPEHDHYFQQQNLTFGKRILPNRNRLVRTMQGADGMKTGYVCASGFNLVASATRDGRRLIAVVMGYKNSLARADAAQALLTWGFRNPPPGPVVKVGEIVNLPQGAIVPSDLTPTMCKTKPLVSLRDGSTLNGWGISLGTYETSQKADMALRGRLLSPVAIDVTAPWGVVRLPEKKGYGVWLWNLDESRSQELCRLYKQDGAHCEVIAPDVTEKIAEKAKAGRTAAAAAAQKKIDDARGNALRQVFKRQFGH